jgi:rod shape-determining protein MreC
MPRSKSGGYLRAETQRGRKRWLFALLGLALLIATIKSCTLLSGRTNPVDQAINTLASPLVYVTMRIGEGFGSLVHIFRLPVLLREEKRLTAENKLLERRVEELKQLETENERLRALLKLHVPSGFKPVSATVIARPYDLWLEAVIINAGRGDGVRKGNLVVNESGVIGKVIEAEAAFSRVQLISSPQFPLGAMSASSRDEGVVRGISTGMMELDFIPAGSRITTGEKLFTLGNDSYGGAEENRPRGVLIGSVTGRVADPNGFLEITVQPAAQVNRLSWVVVFTK